ncbi:MAG: FHA domain-containing protein [Fimbriimonadaceae bacterium]|nr:FHA domain-containing protein [Fimbriimonadaceae bacterium]
MGRVLTKAVLCAVAGVLGWVMTEPLMPTDSRNADWAARERVMVLVIVALIGLVAGLIQGFQRGGKTNIMLAGGLGLVFGSIGGLFGHSIGGAMVAGMFRPDVFFGGFSPATVVARIVAFAPIGALLGAAIGGTQMSKRGVVSGVLGGLIGAVLAGATFDLIGSALAPLLMTMRGNNEVGLGSRAVTALSLGLFVGLFTALADLASRQAWLRLVLGRNEGKEWPIDAAQTNIGRDERAHVPLFNDPNVAPLQAVIVRQGTQYVLHDPGLSPVGVGLNGHRLMQPTALNRGDTIMVGSNQLQFLMKASAAARAHEGRHAAVMVGGPQVGPARPAPTAPVQPMPQQAVAPQTQAYHPPVQTQAYQAPAASAAAVLIATAGPLTGQRFPIDQPVQVGREGQGIPMGFDTMASRRHAALTPLPGGLAVQDLGSTNGTMVNGQRVGTATMRPGDTLQIGSSTFRLE